MLDHDKALERIGKLLRLSESSNVHEAAAAAARAQSLMHEHGITRAAVEIAQEQAQGPTHRPNPPASTQTQAQAPFTWGQQTPRPPSAPYTPYTPSHLYDTGSVPEGSLHAATGRYEPWLGMLAQCLATHNACATYVHRTKPPHPRSYQIEIIGRPEDVGSVRCLFSYLTSEILRLSKNAGKDHPASWRTNFRLGAVAAIAEHLNTLLAETVQSLSVRYPHPMSLANLASALKRREQHLREAQDAVRCLHATEAPPPGHQSVPDGHLAGRVAAQTLDLHKHQPLGGQPLLVHPTWPFPWTRS